MKKLLFTLMVAVLSISIVGCMDPGDTSSESKEPQSVTESVIESLESEINSEESKEESKSEESESESVVESEEASESESVVESEPEVELAMIVISYKINYGDATTEIIKTAKVGDTITIALPSIPVDDSADYVFSGWKIVETGAKYDKDTTEITITVEGDIAIECIFVKQYTGNY